MGTKVTQVRRNERPFCSKLFYLTFEKLQNQIYSEEQFCTVYTTYRGVQCSIELKNLPNPMKTNLFCTFKSNFNFNIES